MRERILHTVEKNILIITLNRPEAYNAWTIAMRNRITEILLDANKDDSIRVVLFTGAGERAFCAGQDLAETQQFVAGKNIPQWISDLRRLYDAVRILEKPTVVALNGLAAGSGFQLTLLVDVVVGHKGIKLGQPEVNSGIPSILGYWMMEQNLGRSRAAELAVTGRLMEADECFRLGLLHHLVDQPDVLPTALKIAEELAGKPKQAMRITKQYFRYFEQEAYDRAMKFAEEGQMVGFETGEPQRCMAEFFARRKKSQ